MTLPDGLELRPFDAHRASVAEFAALTAFTNSIRVQPRPEYPRTQRP